MSRSSWAFIVALTAGISLAAAAEPGQTTQPAGGPSLHVTNQRGRYFTYMLPSGWHASETTSGVDMTTPDDQVVVSHAVLRGMGTANAQQVVHMAMGVPELRGMQISSVRQVTGPIGPGLACELGGAASGLIAVQVRQYMGGYFADCILIRCPSEAWSSRAALLVSLSQSVTIWNTAEACGNDTLIAFRPVSEGGVSLNHPNEAGDIIMQGWESRNRVMDNVFRRNDEAVRGVHTYTSPNLDHPVQVDNRYDNVWASSGGQVTVSDSPSFNPNANGGSWQPANQQH